VSRKEMLDVLARRYGRIVPVVETSSRRPTGSGCRTAPSSASSRPRRRRSAPECDRSGSTADGLWYLCLYAMRGIDLRGPLRGGASNAQLKALIAGGWTARTDRGAEDRLALGERTPLVQIGGLKRDPHLEMHTRGG